MALTFGLEGQGHILFLIINCIDALGLIVCSTLNDAFMA